MIRAVCQRKHRYCTSRYDTVRENALDRKGSNFQKIRMRRKLVAMIPASAGKDLRATCQERVQ